MVELIGYAGSVLVVLSFTMRRIVPLRLVSVGGAIITAVYGLMIHAWPVLITNLIIVGIHAWHLYREFTTSHEFGLVPVERGVDDEAVSGPWSDARPRSTSCRGMSG